MTAAFSSRNSLYGPIALRDEPWWQIGRRAAQRGDVGPDGSVYEPDIELELLVLLHESGALERLELPVIDSATRQAHQLLFSAQEWAPVIGQYELHGRQIFDMSSGLVEMLQETDVRQCTLQNLQLPYPAFYMHFGRQAELKVVGAGGDTEYIDGVLVAHAQGDGIQLLKFATTSIDESGRRVTLPGHFLSLDDAGMQLPVHAAIDAAVERFVDAGVSPGEFPSAEAFWICLRQRAADALKVALPLIVNGLFYLENPPRPPRKVPGAGTPDGLVARWERTPADRRRKLNSKLSAEGYTMVHLVGEEIAHSSNQGGGGTVAPHWRRGHWREQAYGQRLSLRKRILIRPTLVNGHDVADPLKVKGHVYKPPREPGPSPQT